MSDRWITVECPRCMGNFWQKLDCQTQTYATPVEHLEADAVAYEDEVMRLQEENERLQRYIDAQKLELAMVRDELQSKVTRLFWANRTFGM